MNIFCDECKRNIATVFLTKMAGSEVSRVQLCEECARKMEQTTEAEDNAEEALGGEPLTCSSCGTSFNDFQKMGFLGCSGCYREFGEPLDKVISEFQDASEHLGKTPRKAGEGARLRRKLIELERNLERQIAEEQYEAAAAVRDKIREIEDRLAREDGGER